MRSKYTGAEHKGRVLQELRELTLDRSSRSQTVLGRFLQCQQLQTASALLAKAVEQSRWHRGKRLQPPGGSLPPNS